MSLHINAKTELWKRFKEFIADEEDFYQKVDDITHQKYRYLIKLYYDQNLDEVRNQLTGLGIKLT